MITATLKTDEEIKNDVLSELKFQPSVKISDIGVLVKDGTVTLNGFATSYGEKWDAVKSAKRVAGVKAIADDIEVKFADSLKRSDGDIAATASESIEWSWTVPMKAVQVTVSDGWVTLEGELEWKFQKDAAEDSVRNLSGVKGVINLISIKPTAKAENIETAIRSAFERNALLEANDIEVTTSGSKVTLTGEVNTYSEYDEAERIAWAAPGVALVDNQLIVEWEDVEDE